jgi:branched-subunit amino acid aminotransferase/4-amino-4-deoxychorismate lyase
LAGGVYTTLRTYQHGKALHLQDHFDRLEQSVKLQGREIILPRGFVREAMREILKQYPETDIRMRIHCSLLADRFHLYFMAEPFVPYSEETYLNGVSAMTLEMQRENPASKATNFIDLTREIRKSKPTGINEYLMIGKEKRLLEGMSSNIFIIKDRTIWTASEGILPGITRQMALTTISGLDLMVLYNGFPVEMIREIDELFITSASRGVMPVTKINDLPVGTGKPGPITRQIRSEFERLLYLELESV